MIPEIVVLAGLAAQASAPDALAPIARRLSDPVAFLDGRRRREEMLPWWDKARRLSIGDGLRSGPAGAAEILFPRDGALLTLRGAWRLVLREESEKSFAVECAEAARAECRLSRREGTLRVAGFGEIEASQTSFRLERDERGGLLWIRNAGPGVVRVRSEALAEGRLELGPGEEAAVPRRAEGGGAAERVLLFLGRPVEVREGAAARVRGTQLLLEGGGNVAVAGAVLRPAGGLLVRAPRREARR